MQDGQNQPQVPPDQPPANWQFQAPVPPVSPAPTQTPAQPAQTPAHVQSSTQVSWTASEFVAHHKNAGWYLALIGIIVLLAAAVFALTEDLVSTVVIAIVGISFGFFAARKPRELQYALDTSGIHMGEKFYPYSQFKSFSLVQEDAAQSVWLMPLKRFMPILTMYFDPNDQDKIASTLSNFLPFEEHQPDAVDRVMHRIRF
jgi:hypothetical protein